jgi:hypothetical protein
MNQRKQNLAWNILVILSMFFLAVVLPLILVLPSFRSINLNVLLFLSTVVFAVDSYLDYNDAKKTSSVNFKRFLQTFLIFDIAGSLPLYLFIPDSPFILIQVLKIISVGTIINSYARYYARYTAIIRLANFGYILLILLHWIACAWIAIRPPEAENDVTHYIKSLYWSTTTLATVGYGDITPKTNEEMIFAICVMLVGVVTYGYLIGNIASLLSNIDPARVHHQENLKKAHAFIRYRQLPSDLEKRINDFYTYIWEQRLGYDESSVLSALPPGLRTEISLFLKKDVIQKVEIFQKASDEFIREIAQHLRPQIAMPGEVIFHAGDTARNMYFISKGLVEIIGADGNIITTRSDGDFFGELALLYKRKRSASVRAVDYSDMYVLDVNVFEKVLAEHPDFYTQLEQYALERMQ